ncbi:MAG TPA: FecR family protein [Gemmatimonadaceae bacterium]|nr:FecR family protein [Gemmatimonadaceae bacterium]
MTVTSQPTDQPTGQILTDQKVLEKLFRQHYARYLASAKKQLGEPAHAAPRVVSKAFNQAWQDRKRFTSFDELDAFIGAQIHYGATREVSRRAGLHRMDHHEGLGGGAHTKHETHEMTVDEAWDRLEHTLQGGAPEAYRARASSARHEAAEHVKGLAKGTNWTPMILIGLVGLVVIAAATWYAGKVGSERALGNALSGADVRHSEIGAGQVANVTFPDSTIALLGPESRVTVPNRFGPKVRGVKLEGVASFNVTKAQPVPFEVRAGDVAVIARGTVFTVRRYRDEANVIVHVREGTVDVRHGETIRNVPQGMSLRVAADGKMSVPSAEELQEATTWIDGNVTIAGRELRYVLPQVKRWFGLDIKVQDTTLLRRTVFLSAPMNSRGGAVRSIEQSGGLRFTQIGDNMAFEDTLPSRPARRR